MGGGGGDQTQVVCDLCWTRRRAKCLDIFIFHSCRFVCGVLLSNHLSLVPNLWLVFIAKIRKSVFLFLTSIYYYYFPKKINKHFIRTHALITTHTFYAPSTCVLLLFNETKKTRKRIETKQSVSEVRQNQTFRWSRFSALQIQTTRQLIWFIFGSKQYKIALARLLLLGLFRTCLQLGYSLQQEGELFLLLTALNYQDPLRYIRHSHDAAMRCKPGGLGEGMVGVWVFVEYLFLDFWFVVKPRDSRGRLAIQIESHVGQVRWIAQTGSGLNVYKDGVRWVDFLCSWCWKDICNGYCGHRIYQRKKTLEVLKRIPGFM